LHYLDTGGPGIPVLLLHGINQNVRQWELVLPHLIGPWRLIAVDHRGHGLSGVPKTPYQRGDLVRDYVELIPALGLQRPIVVGHSLGAWVGMSLAGAQPGLVGGLVLGDMSPCPRRTQTAERSQRMRAAFEPGVGDATWVDEEEAFRSMRAAYLQETDDEVRALMRQQLQRNGAGYLERARNPVVALSIFEDIAGSDVWPLLPRIDVPTRVVFAERSDVLGRADAERMVRELSRGELVVIPDAHHNLQLCQPRLWGEAIAGFLRNSVSIGA
jgi:pimeloyl-ACP methyl ester carboxylesterase